MYKLNFLKIVIVACLGKSSMSYKSFWKYILLRHISVFFMHKSFHLEKNTMENVFLK